MISFQTLGMYKDSIYNQHVLAKYCDLFHKLDYLWTIKILRNPLMENVEYDLLSFLRQPWLRGCKNSLKELKAYMVYIYEENATVSSHMFVPCKLPTHVLDESLAKSSSIRQTEFNRVL